MSMSKKDYIVIAESIRTQVKQLDRYPKGDALANVLRRNLQALADNLAVNLAVENPRFDRERFMKACGF